MRRALVGSAVLLLTAGFAAAAQDRWLHVKVVDAAKGGESVNVNVPLELAEKVLPTIQAEKLSHGKIKIEGEIEGVDIHALNFALNLDLSMAQFFSLDGRKYFLSQFQRDVDVDAFTAFCSIYDFDVQPAVLRRRCETRC